MTTEVIKKVEQLLNNPHVPQHVKDDIVARVKKADNCDFELQNHLKQAYGAKDMQEYKDLLKDIQEEAVVLCYAKSDVFVRYLKDQVKIQLLTDIAQFKKRTEILQVVPHETRQKFLIIYETNGDIQQHMPGIIKLRKYIVEYFATKLQTKLNESDIILHKDKFNNCLFIVNAIVNSLKEKCQIRHDLLDYIENKEKGSELTKKISHDNQFHSGSEDYYLYDVGFDGLELTTDVLGSFIKNVDLLLGIKQNYPVVNIHNTIIGNNNTLTSIAGNNNSTNVVSNSKLSAVETFIKFVKEQQPEWYKDGQWINRVELKKKYEEITGDTLSDKMFHNVAVKNFADRFQRCKVKGKDMISVKLKKITDLK